jgi:hypothetical protein
VAVPDGYVDSFLGGRKAERFETVGRHQENPRLEIRRLFLDTMAECLKQHVPACCPEFAFNVGEVGISESEDRAPRKVIVPIPMPRPAIHSLHRNLKRIPAVYYLSVAGQSMAAVMVSS